MPYQKGEEQQYTAQEAYGSPVLADAYAVGGYRSSSAASGGQPPPVVPTNWGPAPGAVSPPPSPPSQTSIPGSTYVPPEQRPITLPREEGVRPGPPSNYVPGSTYIPTDDAIAQEYYEWPPGEGSPRHPPVNPTLVPGTIFYGRGKGSEPNPISPGLGMGRPTTHGPGYYAGLGGYGVPGREYAPRERGKWVAADPYAPQMEIPGSTYVPDYIGMPPLGSERRRYRGIRPASEYYGGNVGRIGEGDVRLRSYKGYIFTTYPSSGAPETWRYSGYVPENATLLQMGALANDRPWDEDEPEAQSRSDTLNQMEWGRQTRGYPLDPRSIEERLRGLFGGG